MDCQQLGLQLSQAGTVVGLVVGHWCTQALGIHFISGPGEAEALVGALVRSHISWVELKEMNDPISEIIGRGCDQP